MEDDQVREYLSKQDIHKPMGCDGRSCLTILINLHEKMTVSVDECRATCSHWSYLGVNKVFDSLSCKILIEKLTSYGLGEQTLGWTVSWLKAPTVVAGGIRSSWGSVARSVPQRSTLGSALLKIFIKVLDDGIEYNLSWFLSVTTQGRVDYQRPEVVMASGGTWTGWRNGLTGTPWVSPRVNVRSCTGEEINQGSVVRQYMWGGWLAGKQLCRKERNCATQWIQSETQRKLMVPWAV